MEQDKIKEGYEIYPSDLFIHEYFKASTEIGALYQVCKNLFRHNESEGESTEMDFYRIFNYCSEAEAYREKYGFPLLHFVKSRKIGTKLRSETKLKSEIKSFCKKNNLEELYKEIEADKAKHQTVKFSWGEAEINTTDEPTASLEKNHEEKEKMRVKMVLCEAIEVAKGSYSLYDIQNLLTTVSLPNANRSKNGYNEDDFKVCFAFALRQRSENTRAFLDYRLKRDFLGDIDQFKDFVKDTIEEFSTDPDFFPPTIAAPVKEKTGFEFSKQSTMTTEPEGKADKNQKNITARVLAIKYILEEIPFNRHQLNSVNFIRFVMGKEYQENPTGSQEHTDYYNPTYKSNSALRNDLLKVKEWFEKMELTDLALRVQKDINRLKS